MRKWTVSLVLSLALLSATPWARSLGQTLQKVEPAAKQAAPNAAPPAAKAEELSLEKLLVRALKFNPDIRVAEAKVREAEAELNRTRLLVTQKVVMLAESIARQKEMLEATKADFKNAVSPISSRMKQSLVTQKAKLAELEAEVPYITGKPVAQSTLDSSSDAELLDARIRVMWERLGLASMGPAGPQGKNTGGIRRQEGISETSAAKLRKALDAPVRVDIQEKQPLRDTLTFLEEATPGLSFQIGSGATSGIADLGSSPVALRLRDAQPIGAILQALEDALATERIKFVVRDYGILAILEGDMPPEAIRVNQFWKAGEPNKTK